LLANQSCQSTPLWLIHRVRQQAGFYRECVTPRSSPPNPEDAAHRWDPIQRTPRTCRTGFSREEAGSGALTLESVEPNDFPAEAGPTTLDVQSVKIHTRQDRPPLTHPPQC
jgi:hypothetical protein